MVSESETVFYGLNPAIVCEEIDFRLIPALDLDRFPFAIIQNEAGRPFTPRNLEMIEREMVKNGYSFVSLTEVNPMLIRLSSFKIP
jgi:hypothetical protein